MNEDEKIEKEILDAMKEFASEKNVSLDEVRQEINEISKFIKDASKKLLDSEMELFKILELTLSKKSEKSSYLLARNIEINVVMNLLVYIRNKWNLNIIEFVKEIDGDCDDCSMKLYDMNKFLKKEV